MRNRGRRAKPLALQVLVRERIYILFNLAGENVKTHPDRSKRYVMLARRLGTRYLVRLGRRLKQKFCKKCGSAWVPGFNLKVRLKSKDKVLEYACLNCGAVKRFSYLREKKQTD